MAKDLFTKNWIISNAIQICSEYEKGVLTLRALHYQLVGKGMTNDTQHYKRVVTSMIDARWDKIIDFDTFSDLDRGMVGETKFQETSVWKAVVQGKQQVRAWMNAYSKNRWENQEMYPEIFIEKKALQGVFQKVCSDWNVALGACKGYPSLTFLNESAQRFKVAELNGKNPVILYFGDYDPSGEDIPRSIQENLGRFGITMNVKRIALMEDQVVKWNLPPAPAKPGDSRTANWGGLGQVELDAVRPEKLMELLTESLESVFDQDKYNELIEKENEERIEYRSELKEFVQTL